MNDHIADHIQAVFFDFDDTLVGTIEPKWAEHKYVAKTYYNKELTDDDLREHWGKPLHELVCIIYGTDNAEEAISYGNQHRAQYPKILFKVTIPLIHRLHALGKRLGIVTATTRESLEHTTALHTMPLDLFDYTQSLEDTEFHKPDPRVFDPVLEWLGQNKLKPEELIYIGDSLKDMKAALGAGFNFLGVETGLVTAEEFKKEGARSIASLEDLYQ